MAETTDVARELASICEKLSVQTNSLGDKFLAKKFNVPAWSPDFFELIFAIVERTRELEAILEQEGTAIEVLSDLKTHIAEIRSAFDKTAMSRQWDQVGLARVSAAHSSPVKVASLAIAAKYSYPKLNEEEASELIDMVDELLNWLREHQLHERDFIRATLIEGLERFRFRFQRLEWLGWGYTVQSLRDVICAYMALERGIKPNQNPDASAALQKIGGVLKKVYGYTKAAKDASDTGDWVLRLLGAMYLVQHGGAATVGLLPAP